MYPHVSFEMHRALVEDRQRALRTDAAGYALAGTHSRPLSGVALLRQAGASLRDMLLGREARTAAADCA